MTGRKITQAELILNGITIPPLYLCAQPGCVNTVRTDGEFCDFHPTWARQS